MAKGISLTAVMSRSVCMYTYIHTYDRVCVGRIYIAALLDYETKAGVERRGSQVLVIRLICMSIARCV